MRFYTKIIGLILIISFAASLSLSAKDKKGEDFTVVIDAGHGGKDIGATDNKAREKDINLGVALQLQDIIKKKLKEVKVVMTRDDDKYLTLQQRADIANKSKGDLFISIHTNSLDKSNKRRKSVAGSSVYALGLHKDDNNMRVARRENSVIELEQNYEQKYSGFDPSKDESYIIFEMAQKKNLSKSIKFAEEAQKQLVKSGRVNRGVHQAGFWVLWATSMPSVLIELDFICNPESARYLTSKKGQKELASAIFKAVDSYYENWSKSVKTTADHRMGSETHAKDYEMQEVAVEETSSESPVVISTRRYASKKMESAPSLRADNGSYATSRRRRRSASSRKKSESRNLETASIPLHSESERRGKVVELEMASVSYEVVDETLSSDKADKKNKKKDKKAEKERKKREKRKKSARPASSHNAKTDKFVTVYKIQVLASEDLLKQNNPRFCGLSPITTYKENNLYKYYFGESSDRNEISEMLKDVKKKIPDAFIISSIKSKSSAKK